MLQAVLMARLANLGRNSSLHHIPKDIIEDLILSKNALAHVHVAHHVTDDKRTLLRALQLMFDEEKWRLEIAFQDIEANFNDPEYSYDDAKRLHFEGMPPGAFRKLWDFIRIQMDRNSVEPYPNNTNTRFIVRLRDNDEGHRDLIFDIDFGNQNDIIVFGIGFKEGAQIPNAFHKQESLDFFISSIERLHHIILLPFSHTIQ
jgi:hypothetical protein